MHTDASRAYAQLLADVSVLQKMHRGVSPTPHPVPRAHEVIRPVRQEPGIWRDLAHDVADPQAALGVVVWACVRAADDDATGAAALRGQPLPSLAALPKPPETPRDVQRRAADGPCTPSWTSEEARRCVVDEWGAQGLVRCLGAWPLS